MSWFSVQAVAGKSAALPVKLDPRRFVVTKDVSTPLFKLVPRYLSYFWLGSSGALFVPMLIDYFNLWG